MQWVPFILGAVLIGLMVLAYWKHSHPREAGRERAGGLNAENATQREETSQGSLRRWAISADAMF